MRLVCLWLAGFALLRLRSWTVCHVSLCVQATPIRLSKCDSCCRPCKLLAANTCFTHACDISTKHTRRNTHLGIADVGVAPCVVISLNLVLVLFKECL